MSLIAPPGGRTPPVRISRPSERRSLSRSATRALDVLECFGKERRWLKAIEIGRMLDLQGSTTNQQLKTMVDSAHLVFDARRKTYFPSPRLIAFSNLMTNAFGQDDRLRQLAADIHARTGLSITLTTPNGLFMQILHLEMPVGQHTERGLKVGLFGSVIGSAYLASLSDSEIGELASRAGFKPDMVPAIVQNAQKVRADGYADGSGPDQSVWTIAMVLPQGNSPIPMVLAVAGDRLAVQEQDDKLRAMMRGALQHWLQPVGED